MLSPWEEAGNQIPYRGNLKWLVPRTILFTLHGSRAYGTERPDSDWDYRGVAVAPIDYRDGLLRFAQAESKNHRLKQDKEPNEVNEEIEIAGDDAALDYVIYDLRKFISLATQCNPSILDILWAEDESVLVSTEAGTILRANKDLFLSRRVVHTYRGYAMSQLKRILRHRAWLLNPLKKQPERSDFGLPNKTLIPADQRAAAEAQTKKVVDGWEIDFGDLLEASKLHIQEQIENYLTELAIGTDEKYRAAGRLLGFEDNFIHLLEHERAYRQAQNNWKSYNHWVATRNPARAALEAKYGFDCKHASHLIRLLRMCREVLTEGVLRVRRPDAEELRGIINGAWSFDQLIAWATLQDQELLEISKTSQLPKNPPRAKINELCVYLHSLLPNK